MTRTSMAFLDVARAAPPALLLLGLAVGCAGGNDKGGEDGGADGGGVGDGGTGDGGDGGGEDSGDGGTSALPPKPDPFTLTVRGGTSLDLYFDTPTCQKPKGGSNFRAFWRDSTGSHVFVLVADLLGTFDGAGTYTTADANATIKLQEEAGGSGAYYATDDDQGDSASITVEAIDEELGIAWGEFEVDGLHSSSAGGITVSPMPVPIWCETLR